MKVKRKQGSIGKQLLSCVLALALVFSLLPAGVFDLTARAEEDGGETEDDTLLIGSVAEWNAFARSVNSGNTYAGKKVKLTADIGSAEEPVTEMVGTEAEEGYVFEGTLLGNGHTLTIKLGSEEVSMHALYTAPFQFVNNATFSNLHVTGEIYTYAKWAAGMIGYTMGDCRVQNCRSSVTIHTSFNGWGHMGGLVGFADGDLSFDNCLFDGTYIQKRNRTIACSGFVGLPEGIVHIKNGLVDPSSDSSIDKQLSGTFVYTDLFRFSDVKNIYYVSPVGNAQGTDASGMDPETLAEKLGPGWEVEDGKVRPVMDPNNLSTWEVTGLRNRYYYDDGKEIRISFDVFDGNGLEVAKDQYDTMLSFGESNVVEAVADRGEYTLTITGKAPYTGSLKRTFSVGDIPATPEGMYEDSDYAYPEPQFFCVNMPITGKKTISLAEYIPAFTIYDNGGKALAYTKNCDGYLTLAAPAGYLIGLEGTIKTKKTKDYLVVYDGRDENAEVIESLSSTSDGSETAISPALSKGSYLTLYFHSGEGPRYSGLDLRATLIPAYTVSFDGGEEIPGFPDPILIREDEEYTLPTIGFALPKEKVLKEWSVKVGDANPVTKAPGDTIIISADTALTAVWTDAVLIHPTVSQNGWNYGEDHAAPTVSGNEAGAEVIYTYFTDENCSEMTTEENSGADCAGGEPKYAGTYYLKAEIPATGPYYFGEALTSFTIAKIPAVLKKDPDPKTNATYSDPYLYLLNDRGECEGGTMVFSFGQDQDYFEDYPKGDRAKSYVIWYKVRGDRNHTDTEPRSLTVTIGKGNKIENKPKDTISAVYTCDVVSKVSLPEGWIWVAEDRNKTIPVEDSVSARALYDGEDADSYTDEAKVTTVSIFRNKCYHRNTLVENEKAATCEEEGYTGDVVCRDCGETLRTGQTITKLSHVKKTEKENVVPATCLEEGSYDEVVRCADCDALISSKHCIIKALGHSYGAPVYTWSEDGKKCAATVTCLREDCAADAKDHTVTEEAVVSAKVLTYPTKGALGITRYTAVFTGKLFTTQVKDVADIAKLPGAYSGAGVTAKGSLKAGDHFTAEKAKAELVLLSLEGDKPAAAYAGPVNTKLKNISVPLTITDEGVTYAVTKVEDQAFHDCKKAKEIIIGRNVEKLGRNLFKGNKKLRSVIILTTKLNSKTVAKDTFSGVGPKVKVMVPKDKYRAYKKILKKSGLNKKIIIEAMR